jgi:hypothetical protein
MSNKIEYKIIENFNEIFEALKDEENMIVDKSYYETLYKDISKGEHKHFGAYENNKLIGTSSMIKFFDSKKNDEKIYHLWSWTHKKYRHKKIWLYLMKMKANYIMENKWCNDNTSNWVAVSDSDNRYKNLGWTYTYNVNNLFKGKNVSKKIWYILWKNYKNISLFIIDYKLKLNEKTHNV